MKRLFAFTLALFSIQSLAAEYERCDSAVNTMEIDQCLGGEFDKYDKRLNQAYQKTLKDLEPSVRKALVEAQRAWIIFRDKECDAVYAFWREGTIRNAKYMGCKIEKTSQRTDELTDWGSP